MSDDDELWPHIEAMRKESRPAPAAQYVGWCSRCKQERRLAIEHPPEINPPGVIGAYCRGERDGAAAHGIVLTLRIRREAA